MLQITKGSAFKGFTSEESQEIEVFLRYFFRKHLKDELRPSIMNVVKDYATRHNLNPRRLCSAVHDQMNLSLQGITAKEFRQLNDLPAKCYIRDYFELEILRHYISLNEHVEEWVSEEDVHPVEAVKQVCQRILPRRYHPQPRPIAENINSAVKRESKNRAVRQRSMPQQLTIWGEAS